VVETKPSASPRGAHRLQGVRRRSSSLGRTTIRTHPRFAGSSTHTPDIDQHKERRDEDSPPWTIV